MSRGTSNPKHFFFFFLRHSALQFVQKHFSILNDISLWADNWRDSVNCNKLKVLSNYTDSHRRIKVSASLCGATPLMRRPPIIETRHPPRGTSSGVPWLPLMGPILLLVHRNMFFFFFFLCQLRYPTTSSFPKWFSWQRSLLLIQAARFFFFPHIGHTNNNHQIASSWAMSPSVKFLSSDVQSGFSSSPTVEWQAD